jgi:hypothetical protein
MYALIRPEGKRLQEVYNTVHNIVFNQLTRSSSEGFGNVERLDALEKQVQSCIDGVPVKIESFPAYDTILVWPITFFGYYHHRHTGT